MQTNKENRCGQHMYTNTEVNNKPFTLQDKANRCESTKTPDGTSWLRQKNKEKGIRPTLR